MPQYVRAKVCGEAPMRDALTRESVQPGGEVTLLVRTPGEDLPRCPRHPKKGVNDPKRRCVCHGTVIEWAVEQGVIADVTPFDPDAKPAKKA
jgi:hypothetical protein